MTHFYALWGDLVAGVLEVEHGPEFSIRIRLADLVQRGIVLVDDLVDG